MSILNTVFSVFFLHRAVNSSVHQSRNIAISVALGLLATLSFGNGILVWPIGLLSLYFWKAPLRFMMCFLVGMFFALGFYLFMPGGDAVGASLQWNGWEVFLFPLQLMGAPLFHLLRAADVLPANFLMPLATGLGVLICLVSVLLLWHRLQHRAAVDRLDAVALTMVLIGFGTVFLLMLTRVQGVLDPAVDRFQIWALLVWLGLSLLLYRGASPAGRRGWHAMIFLFPLLALPAQLDWGARLAEYRTRVDNALLAYQVYLPEADDAEKALHWNWQNKLPFLFPVLEIMRASNGNIFSEGAAQWLGKSPSFAADLPNCQWTVLREELVTAERLLDVAGIADAELYKVPAVIGAQPVGARWYANVAVTGWDAGLLLDDSGAVRGLLQPVRHSLLPRASGVRHDLYNAYGVARSGQPIAHVVLLAHDQPLCMQALK